jgi:hypothetical protein
MWNLNVLRVLWAELWFFFVFYSLKIASYSSHKFMPIAYKYEEAPFRRYKKKLKIKNHNSAQRTCSTFRFHMSGYFLCSFQWCRFWQKDGDSIGEFKATQLSAEQNDKNIKKPIEQLVLYKIIVVFVSDIFACKLINLLFKQILS